MRRSLLLLAAPLVTVLPHSLPCASSHLGGSLLLLREPPAIGGVPAPSSQDKHPGVAVGGGGVVGGLGGSGAVEPLSHKHTKAATRTQAQTGAQG